ncbi:MAG: hypothetical protein AAGA23_02935 [Pseudomonadota bacterium]
MNKVIGAAALLIAGQVSAGALTEFHDPQRGLKFSSIQMPAVSLVALQEMDGKFVASDELVMGMSALVLDEAGTAEEFILWMKHEGPRRWFINPQAQPLSILLEDRRVTPTPRHIELNLENASQPFVDKLEFALSPELARILLSEKTISLRLETLMGTIKKDLTPEMITKLRNFTQRLSKPQVGSPTELVSAP